MALDFNAIREALKKKKAGLKTAGKTIKPKVGVNRYVILPPYNEEGAWSHDFGQHFIKDEADQTQAIYVCAAETNGTPCAVCDALAEAQRDVGLHNPQMAEILKKSKAGRSWLVNVLALDSDTPDDPQVLTLGKSAYEQLIATLDEWAESVWDASNPQIVTIERTGTTQNDTKYNVVISSKKHTLKKAVKPANLDEFVAQESEEGKRKAVLALQRISGVAPGLALPGAGNPDVPKLAGKSKPAADEFEDVPDLPATPAAKSTVASPNLADDVDALMADLGL